MMMNQVSPIPIAQYFAGQHIFMTGGTGFMGKVLIEKILRCCPEVAKIYLLIRPKRQKSIEERWNELTNTELFELLKSTNPGALKKIHLIPGDTNEDNLGLSEENLTILRDNVTIVYHVAAMVQFKEYLVEAININTRVTHVLLEMGMLMRKLKIFVYISTAFSNSHIPCEESVEEVLPAVQDWKVMLKLCDREPETIALMKEKLMCGHPNPYTFSKSLSEQIVDHYKSDFPTVIVRPALVNCCNRDPVEGWIDALSGLGAQCTPSVLGLSRAFLFSKDAMLDYIPADTAINAIILATAKKLSEPVLGQTDVYNCGILRDKPTDLLAIIAMAPELVENAPSKYMIWVPHIVRTANEPLYKIMSLFLNVCPAIFFDFILLLTFNKPRLFKIVKKLSNVIRVCKKFSLSRQEFPNDKFKALQHFLPYEEEKSFTINNDEYTCEDMIRINYRGILKFILKEDMSKAALEKNKRKLVWLKLLDGLVIYGFYGICANCLYQYSTHLWLINSCNRDPVEGWIDTLSGLGTQCTPVFLGLSRTVHCTRDAMVDYIPADTAINAIILATAKKLNEPVLGQTDVYNCGMLRDKPTDSVAIRGMLPQLVEDAPSKYMIWVPHIVRTANEPLYKIMSLFLNVCPAIFFDFILLLTFNKPRLLKIVKKLSNVIRVCKKFSLSRQEFPNDKFKALQHFLPYEEEKSFTINNDEYTCEDMIRINYRGILKFILKEDMSEAALEKNKRRLVWLKILDGLMIYGFYGICAYCLYQYSRHLGLIE